MKSIGQHDYAELIDGAEVLALDPHGDKVLQLRDGNILKLFRIKRKLSSARLWNYAQRFASNARRLQKRGFNTVEMVDEFNCPHIDRQCVVYKPLRGMTLRDAMRAKFEQTRMNQFGEYIAALHNKGVYFRAMHLNNVIVCKDDTLGLIDVSEMWIWPWRVGLWKSLRNFKHIVNKNDADIFWLTNMKQFREAYLSARNLPNWQKAFIRRKWRHYTQIGVPAV
jgi:hypothetical protein